jgi:hypothetical protein
VPSRPLGRSLDPLPDEDLGGYLLRLSVHLAMAPLSLARHLGLIARRPSEFNRKLLFTLDVEGLATMTRLTPQEARGLTLLGWQDRYLPIAQVLAHSGDIKREWVLNSTARHCPQCLAGDGSEIQSRYGGAWKKQWRLPIIFACTTHGTLLRDDCALAHVTPRMAMPLVANPTLSSLHPAQCRRSQQSTSGQGNSPCGTNLIQAPEPGMPHLTTSQLETQRRILARLESGANPRAAATYFTDLRLVIALLRTGWPNDLQLIDSDAQELVGEYFRLLAAHNEYDQPPRDAATTAALLNAADAVLDDRARQEELARCIRETRVGRPSREPWVTVLARHASSCSPQVRETFEPLTYTFRRFGRYGPRSSAPAPICRYYRPEHIPAFLEHPWYLHHLAAFSFPTSPINTVRRYAAARLVQWVAGGSISEAAEYLGLPPGKATVNFAKAERRRFDRALGAIVRDIELAPTPINYHARRSALDDWYLAPQDWNRFIKYLRPVQGRRKSQRTDQIRQQASVFIWTRITQGEHHYAPRPIEAAQPHPLQRAWQHEHLRIQRQIEESPRPNGFYAAIRPILVNYAAQLARRIDVGEWPTH